MDDCSDLGCTLKDLDAALNTLGLSSLSIHQARDASTPDEPDFPVGRLPNGGDGHNNSCGDNLDVSPPVSTRLPQIQSITVNLHLVPETLNLEYPFISKNFRDLSD